MTNKINQATNMKVNVVDDKQDKQDKPSNQV